MKLRKFKLMRRVSYPATCLSTYHGFHLQLPFKFNDSTHECVLRYGTTMSWSPLKHVQKRRIYEGEKKGFEIHS